MVDPTKPQHLEIPPEIRAGHELLSPVGGRFLDRVSEDPILADPANHREDLIPEWLAATGRKFELFWPLFVDRDRVREFRTATVGLTALVKSIPSRVFGKNAQQIADFLGVEDPRLMALLLAEPSGLEGSIARCDFVFGPTGFNCVEINLGGFMGGWQAHPFRQAYLGNPGIRDFLDREGIEPRIHDTFGSLVDHVVEDILVNFPDRFGKVNLAMAVLEHTFPPSTEAGVAELYRDCLDGVSGELLFCSYPDGVTCRDDGVYVRGVKVDAIVQYTSDRPPKELFRAFKEERVQLYNAPLPGLLGRKQSLALLSRLEDSEAFDDDERSLIRDHVPWTRAVRPGTTTYEGEEVDLVDLLEDTRRDMVLKPDRGQGGVDVIIGRYSERGEWRAAIERALADGSGWVAQEHVESYPFLLPDEATGPVPHDAVWGLFCFGSRFGGGFLRAIPRGAGSGVINTSRGAKETVFLEV